MTKKVTKIAVHAATGRMGREVLMVLAQSPDVALVAATVRPENRWLHRPVSELVGEEVGNLSFSSSLNDAASLADAMIDFSLPQAMNDVIDACSSERCALLSGTTGLEEREQQRLQQLAQSLPVLWSANMSLGVNLLNELLKVAVQALPQSADVEILERHHRHKKDAPSGTALLLGETIAQARGQQLSEAGQFNRQGRDATRVAGEIGVAALRGGSIAGEHEVMFALDGEQLRLGHIAESRRCFAEGAVTAAQWLVEQPAGRVYSIADMLNSGTRA